MILGQDSLLRYIDSFTLNTFPHTVLLTGMPGSGKHIVSKYIANHLNLELRDLSDSLSLDLLEEIYLSVQPRLFLIDASALKENQQNMILKFLEEPNSNVYIILLATSKEILLPTVTNRCIEFKLQPYPKDILRIYMNTLDLKNDSILDICETPGDINEFSSINYSELQSLALKLIHNISKASYANTLTLLNKVKFRVPKSSVKKSDDSNKFNLFLLARLILKLTFQANLKDDNNWYFDVYRITNIFYKNLIESLKNTGLDQKYIFLNFLISLWNKSRENKYGN